MTDDRTTSRFQATELSSIFTENGKLRKGRLAHQNDARSNNKWRSPFDFDNPPAAPRLRQPRHHRNKQVSSSKPSNNKQEEPTTTKEEKQHDIETAFTNSDDLAVVDAADDVPVESGYGGDSGYDGKDIDYGRYEDCYVNGSLHDRVEEEVVSPVVNGVADRDTDNSRTTLGTIDEEELENALLKNNNGNVVAQKAKAIMDRSKGRAMKLKDETKENMKHLKQKTRDKVKQVKDSVQSKTNDSELLSGVFVDKSKDELKRIQFILLTICGVFFLLLDLILLIVIVASKK